MKKTLIVLTILVLGTKSASGLELAGPPALVLMDKNYLKKTIEVKTVNTCLQEKKKTAEVLNIIIATTKNKKNLKTSGNAKLYKKLKKHYKKLNNICPTEQKVRFFKEKK